MRNIIFTHPGTSAVFGPFVAGGMLRCSDEEARHFVDEAGCAVYGSGGAAAAEAKPPAEPDPKPDKQPITRKPAAGGNKP